MGRGDAPDALRLQRNRLAAVGSSLRQSLAENGFRPLAHQGTAHDGKDRRMELRGTPFRTGKIPPLEIVDERFGLGREIRQSMDPGPAADDLRQSGAVDPARIAKTQSLLRDHGVQGSEAGKIPDLSRSRDRAAFFRERDRRGAVGDLPERLHIQHGLSVGSFPAVPAFLAFDRVFEPGEDGGPSAEGQSVRSVAAEDGKGGIDLEILLEPFHQGGGRPGSRDGEIVRMPRIQHHRGPGLSHSQQDRVIEAARELSAEELLRVVDAPFADDFPQRRDIAGGTGNLDPVVERLHIGAHGPASGTAGNGQFRKIQFRARLHVIDGPHGVPDPEPGEVPARQPRPGAQGGVFLRTLRERIVRGPLDPFSLTVRIGRKHGEAFLRRHDRHVTIPVPEFSRIGVPADQKEGGIRSAEARIFRQIQIAGHIDAGHGLEQDLVHGETISLNPPCDLRLKRRFFRHAAQHVQPEFAPLFLLFLQLLRGPDGEDGTVRVFIRRRHLPEKFMSAFHIHCSLRRYRCDSGKKPENDARRPSH